MKTTQKTPIQGLCILEQLNKEYPLDKSIMDSLLNAYIKLGYHDMALNMICHNNDNNDEANILNAWVAHKKDHIDDERHIWDKIINGDYLPQVHAKINRFISKMHGKLQLQSTDIPLFCVQRNEMLRLPVFLDYYRDLGVTKFIFIDNNSDDGSFEFLMDQPDCYVYWTDDSYLQSAHGLTWLNYLINETDILHINQWYLIADVDELLVYPDCENRKLPILINYLNQEKSEAVASFMLDMYADNLLGYDDNNFINEHVYFYNNYCTYYQASSPYIAKAGGIRIYLYSEYNDACVKTALFKKLNRKSYLLSSTHQTTPYKVSKITTAFKHYKFVDLKNVAKNEIQRKQHSGGGSRYRQYHNYFQNDDKPINFSTLDKTTKYENSQQLIDLNLIQTTDEWTNFNQQKLSKMSGIKILENLYKYYPTDKTVIISLIKAYITTKQYEKALNLSIHHEIHDNTINNFINWYHITKKDSNINENFYNLFQPNFGIYQDKEVDLIRQNQVANQWRILIDAYFNNKLEKFDIQPKKQFSHQKIFWQYWGQGLNDDDLPEVVQMCFRSVDTYKDDYIVIRLDDNLIHEYIDLPDFVYSKRNNPQFTHSHFADLLRLALLNAYGGIWLDARILLTDSIPDNIKHKEFFMFQRNKNTPIQQQKFYYNYNYFYFNWNKSHHVNVMNGVIVSKKFNKINNTCMNLLLNYWKTQNCVPHYFFFQILFDVLSKEYLVEDMDKEIIDDIKPHLLQFVIHEKYDETQFINITNQTSIHSLSSSTSNGNTFYNVLWHKFSPPQYQNYNQEISIVTAFFDIGRNFWTKHVRTTDKYLAYFANLAKLDNEMIIFTTIEYQETILSLRENRPTKIIIFDFANNFIDYRNSVAIIQSSESFKNKINPLMSNNPEYTSADYVVLNNVKSFFVLKAIQEEYISNDMVAWIDFGCCRDNKTLQGIQKWEYTFDKDKMNLFSVNYDYHNLMTEDDVLNCIYNNWVTLIGTYSVATKNIWGKYNQLMTQTQHQLLDNNIIDDDQGVMLMCWFKNKDFFKINYLGYNQWFSMFQKFSN